MPSKHRGFLRLDDNGRLILPEDLAAAWGLEPSGSLPFRVEDGEIRVMPPIHAVQRVYIEPTNQCNLDCRTCMRNAWERAPGRMSAETFDRILDGLQCLLARCRWFSLAGTASRFPTPRSCAWFERSKRWARGRN